MPDGGSGNCGNCRHLSADQRCQIRDVRIEVPYWTTCHNFNDTSTEPDGPIYAVVGIVKDGAGGYRQIPYLNGNRPDTTQEGNGGDTFLHVRDRDGERHEFDTVDDYLRFREQRAEDDAK